VPDLAALYDQHAGAIYAFALHLLQDEPEAKDILHTVFAKLARSADPAPTTPTRSGLLKLTHWLILDRLRQQKSSASRETRWTTESQPLFTASADPDTSLFDEALAGSLLILQVEQRAVVHLHLWENTTFEAIGEMLGISKNTAASRYRLALAKLQDHLRPLYNEIK
jgi:RNA polymerase sigma-70 factor, ECF subfamily